MMEDKKKFIGLRRKIFLSMVSLILLLGLAAAFINQQILFKVLKSEFQNKGLIHARSIAAYSLVDILTDNSSRFKKLLETEKKIDPDTAYIFILNSQGRVLAHTFKKGFPVGPIYDIEVPIFFWIKP